MQTHSAAKNFQCSRCQKSFALKSYLNKHLESACNKIYSNVWACFNNQKCTIGQNTCKNMALQILCKVNHDHTFFIFKIIKTSNFSTPVKNQLNFYKNVSIFQLIQSRVAKPVRSIILLPNLECYLISLSRISHTHNITTSYLYLPL